MRTTIHMVSDLVKVIVWPVSRGSQPRRQPSHKRLLDVYQRHEGEKTNRYTTSNSSMIVWAFHGLSTYQSNGLRARRETRSQRL